MNAGSSGGGVGGRPCPARPSSASLEVDDLAAAPPSRSTSACDTAVGHAAAAPPSGARGSRGPSLAASPSTGSHRAAFSAASMTACQSGVLPTGRARGRRANAARPQQPRPARGRLGDLGRTSGPDAPAVAEAEREPGRILALDDVAREVEAGRRLHAWSLLRPSPRPAGDGLRESSRAGRPDSRAPAATRRRAHRLDRRSRGGLRPSSGRTRGEHG